MRHATANPPPALSAGIHAKARKEPLARCGVWSALRAQVFRHDGKAMPRGAAMRSTPLAMLGLWPARGSAPPKGGVLRTGFDRAAFRAAPEGVGTKGVPRKKFDGLRRVEQRAMKEENRFWPVFLRSSYFQPHALRF